MSDARVVHVSGKIHTSDLRYISDQKHDVYHLPSVGIESLQRLIFYQSSPNIAQRGRLNQNAGNDISIVDSDNYSVR